MMRETNSPALSARNAGSGHRGMWIWGRTHRPGAARRRAAHRYRSRQSRSSRPHKARGSCGGTGRPIRYAACLTRLHGQPARQAPRQSPPAQLRRRSGPDTSHGRHDAVHGRLSLLVVPPPIHRIDVPYTSCILGCRVQVVRLGGLSRRARWSGGATDDQFGVEDDVAPCFAFAVEPFGGGPHCEFGHLDGVLPDGGEVDE